MIDGIERVGVYGGTFAPVHNGHVAAARAFYEQMKLDRVLIIPDRIPPHKTIDEADEPERRISTFRFYIRDGEAWGVKCGSRIYQRVDERKQ